MTTIEVPLLPSIEVQRMLIAQHDILPEFETNFIARYKNLVKLGLPVPARQGKGRPALYDADSFFVSVVAMDLTAIGLRPSLVVKMLREGWGELRQDISEQAGMWQQAQVKGVDSRPQSMWTFPADGFSAMVNPDRLYASPIKLSRLQVDPGSPIVPDSSIVDWQFGLYDMRKMVAFYCRKLVVKLGGADQLAAFINGLQRPWTLLRS